MEHRPGRLVARNFMALGSGEVVARLIAFGAMIYVARTLGAHMYGMIGFATAVVLYLSRVADFGIELSGARELAREPDRLQTLAPSILAVRVVIAITLIAVTSLVGLLLLPQPDGAILAAYSVTLLAVGAGTRWIYLGLERASTVALARTVGEATMALLVLWLVHGPNDVLRAPLAQIAGDLLAAALLAFAVRRHGISLVHRLDWPAVRPLFRRAWPLVLSALLGLIIYNSDLIFLRVFKGTTTVGYYAAAYTLISFLVNLGLSYRMSLLPTLTRLANAKTQQGELYHAAMAHVFAIAFPLGLGGFLLAPQIIQVVFGASFAPAVTALQLLIWSVPLCLLRDVPSAALLANAREDLFFRLTAWGAGLNLVLNALLIPRYGMVGAGIATVTTEAVRLVIAFAYVRTHGFHVRDFTLFGRVSLACVAMTALLLLSRSAGLWIGLALGVAAYLGALVTMGGFTLRRGELPMLKL